VPSGQLRGSDLPGTAPWILEGGAWGGDMPTPPVTSLSVSLPSAQLALTAD